MKAAVLFQTGSPEVLRVCEVPKPKTKPGWVLIKVYAFGLNRSELMMREFEADASYILLPRILGIECVGEIEDVSDSNFKLGQKVVALMGGMGRSFDGSYAEYALIPTKNVFAVEYDCDWIELAAIPETYLTAYGSLIQSLQLKSSDILLVRGGTSATGLAAIQLAKSIGTKVIASTRNEKKLELLKAQGADYVVIDNGTLSEQVKSICPNGINKVLELIGAATISESMKLLRLHGIACMTGILDKKMSLESFYPIKDIPSGVYLTGFMSNAPSHNLIDKIFAHIIKYNLHPTIAKVFTLDEISDAHILMESNQAHGKIIIKINH